MKEALTTGEVAKYCGVNFRTVIRWIEKGYMEAYKLPGRGDNRIPVQSLVTFLENNNMPVPAELREALEPGDPKSSQASSPSPKNAKSSDKPKVLVIEDEELMANAIMRALKRQGYQVEVAVNGIEAGIKLESFKPDLITLDLQMPGMSGFEVLEALRAHAGYEHIKVVVVSAATKLKVLQVMELGVDAVVEKPFKSEELIAKIKPLLEES